MIVSHSSVSDSAPNRSLVVIRFKDEADAAEFAEAYNGKQFNSMEVSEVITRVRSAHELTVI